MLAGLTAAGASVIDTAPAYRQSEEVIGELLADIGNRKQAFIATKVTAPEGDLAKGIAMIEESKRRLKTNVLDLVQIHSLNGVEVLFPHLFELKRKGQMRYVGITTSSSSQHDADGRAHQFAAARLHAGGLFAGAIAPRPKPCCRRRSRSASAC